MANRPSEKRLGKVEANPFNLIIPDVKSFQCGRVACLTDGNVRWLFIFGPTGRRPN
jgi:hypothetical protein